MILHALIVIFIRTIDERKSDYNDAVKLRLRPKSIS